MNFYSILQWSLCFCCAIFGAYLCGTVGFLFGVIIGLSLPLLSSDFPKPKGLEILSPAPITLAIAILIAFFYVLVVSCGDVPRRQDSTQVSESKTEKTENAPKNITVGSRAYIKFSGTYFAAAGPEFESELFDIMQKEDKLRLMEMLVKHRCYDLKNGTPLTIIDGGFMECKVRIDDGTSLDGRTCLVANEFLTSAAPVISPPSPVSEVENKPEPLYDIHEALKDDLHVDFVVEHVTQDLRNEGITVHQAVNMLDILRLACIERTEKIRSHIPEGKDRKEVVRVIDAQRRRIEELMNAGQVEESDGIAVAQPLWTAELNTREKYKTIAKSCRKRLHYH